MTQKQLAVYDAAIKFSLGLMLGAGIGAWVLIFAVMGGVFN